MNKNKQPTTPITSRIPTDNYDYKDDEPIESASNMKQPKTKMSVVQATAALQARINDLAYSLQMLMDRLNSGEVVGRAFGEARESEPFTLDTSLHESLQTVERASVNLAAIDTYLFGKG